MSDLQSTSAGARSEQPEDHRVTPPFLAHDRVSLEAWLDFYRETLVLKVGGLTPAQLCRRAVPPSNLTLVGLVRHLTDVERYWFHTIVTGRAVPTHYCEIDPDGDFHDVAEPDALADLERYAAELPRVRALAAGVDDLDAPLPALRRGREMNLRWVYTHMIEEYARHLGHADLLREVLDGATGY